ncbi:MAG: 2-phosphosulfolactate phosphatase [Bacteroidota bacterium]
MKSQYSKLILHVCFSPELVSAYANEDSIVAVIDVLRASSAICAALHNGAERVIPIVSVDEAKTYKKRGYIVGAERGGEIVEGFEFGNSPFSFMGECVKGKTIVLTTSNGTQAIAAAENTYKVVIASFLNLDAVCNWLSLQTREIVLLCAGWKKKFNLEDTLLAGAIVEQLLKKHDSSQLSDSAIAARHLYLIARNDLYGFLKNSSHSKRLRRLNIDKDIIYCLTPNQTNVIPVLDGHSLIKLKE